SRGPAADQEKLTVELKEGTNHYLMKIVNAGGGAGFYFKAGGSNVPANIVEIAKVPAGQRNDAQRAEIEKHYLGIAPALAEARGKLEAARKEKAEFDQNLPKTLVTTATNPREMRILARGNWLDKSGALVTPAIPEFLGKLETAERRANRLDLAEWVVSPGNPLTARTLVNRVWKLFFGAGLSRNVDD
ncbi:MAG: DUF1553 domain-containing protein, partial [Xanthomonadales bacterium]|nr:DUF1553 domain-containing protein [Xanthomonadales bacterium]NIX12459.1 DUF1553 domain-containing protein [Xanthomonadales bacterium]